MDQDGIGQDRIDQDGIGREGIGREGIGQDGTGREEAGRDQPGTSAGLRLATAADTTAVRELVREAYLPWVEIIGMRPMPMEADYPALIAADRVWVSGDVPGGPVDALIVLIPEDGALLVDNVAVHPAAQGRGLGRRLLAFAEDQARSRGLRVMRLYTNVKMTSNIALYESLGYQRTDHETIEGRQAVHLRKVLPSSG
ncbi:GNAT family N-acetyltransferase [Actinomadura scrupuli]|uniref:GNAT family N-acetyltransferase n=1 Tax=Actinomadura scrupuli TaxID=559629 RepID=UPI003D9835A8